jgi:hypothetical protein
MKMPYWLSPSAAVKDTSGTWRWVLALTPVGRVPTGVHVEILLW